MMIDNFHVSRLAGSPQCSLLFVLSAGSCGRCRAVATGDWPVCRQTQWIGRQSMHSTHSTLLTKCWVLPLLLLLFLLVVRLPTAGLSMAAPLLCPASDHNPNAPSTAAAAAAAAAAAGVSQGASIGLGAVGHQQPVPLLQTLQVTVGLQRYVFGLIWLLVVMLCHMLRRRLHAASTCTVPRLRIKCLAQ